MNRMYHKPVSNVTFISRGPHFLLFFIAVCCTVCVHVLTGQSLDTLFIVGSLVEICVLCCNVTIALT